MHETSIVESLIDLIADELADQGSVRVTLVRLRIGPLAGVVNEALEFAFTACAPGSIIDGARLEIVAVPLTAWCARCNAERQIPSPQLLACPICGEPTPDIRAGRELELAALEVVDLPHAGSSNEAQT